MPQVLPNTTTTDAYPAPATASGAQLGLGGRFSSGFFVVANNAAFGQYFHGNQGQSDNSPDIYLPPGTYPLVGTQKDPIAGMRFKSALAGVPAQVFGVLFGFDEASLLSSAEFTANVSSSGAISGGGGVTELAYQEFTANVAAALSNLDAGGAVVVSAPGITLDGSTKIIVEFYAPEFLVGTAPNQQLTLILRQNGVSIGRIGHITFLGGTGNGQAAGVFTRRLTPGAGTQTFSIAATSPAGAGGAGTVVAGLGGADTNMPGYIRISSFA